MKRLLLLGIFLILSLGLVTASPTPTIDHSFDTLSSSDSGSVTGASLTSNAVSGNAIIFDGVNDYTSISSLAGSGTFTFWVNTETSDESFIGLSFYETALASNRDYIYIKMLSNGKIWSQLSDNSGDSATATSTTAVNDGEWHHVAVKAIGGSSGATGVWIYIDGHLEATGNNTDTNNVNLGSVANHYLGAYHYYSTDGPTVNTPAGYWEGMLDEYRMYGTLTEDEIQEVFSEFQQVFVENVFCSSSQDYTSTYTTDDTTPTFKFNTTEVALCRISSSADNYSTMGSSRNCATTNSTFHSCTIIGGDALDSNSEYVYVTCLNEFGYEKVNESFAVEIVEVDPETRALIHGVEESSIYADASLFDDQAVYLRDASNNQLLDIVDVVAVYGNQRWLLNHETSPNSTLGLFNISPAVYVLDLLDQNYTSIKSQVTSLIDGTVN